MKVKIAISSKEEKEIKNQGNYSQWSVKKSIKTAQNGKNQSIVTDYEENTCLWIMSAY